jgi:hypothetical protein
MLVNPLREFYEVGYGELLGTHREEAVLLATKVAKYGLERVAYHLAALTKRGLYNLDE